MPRKHSRSASWTGLIRTVEKEQKKRDLAIVLTLRHTGLRVSELCALRLGDVELGDRAGIGYPRATATPGRALFQGNVDIGDSAIFCPAE